jgi:outer membrane protein assembly factor BamD (BamD/ComL family)
MDSAKKIAASGPSDPYSAAMALYTAGRYTEAAREFDRVAATSGKNAASAALFAAKSIEASGGCVSAAPRYEAVNSRFPGTSAGAEALWTAAGCYRSAGDVERARALYVALRSVAGYRDRAETELASLPSSVQQQQAAARATTQAKPAAKAPAAAPAGPAKSR